ncbi:MAG: DUF1641 domain-containing protein [Deltaproteobacteria bacterium]|nr:DUF1641 domain-containing protein [Deltaproteobacteria bacterium]
MATAHAKIVNDVVPIEARMADQMMEMNRKLDILTEQMGHLYRRTVALEELKDELMRIAKDGMAALTVELAAIEHEFNAEEIQHLLRKALRATPRLIRLLDMLESVDGLVSEIEPLGKEVMKDLVCKLHTAEEKGYFRLAEGGLQLVDRIAGHYTQDDIDRLSDNIVFILDTVKRMTQPEMLAALNQTLEVIDHPESSSKPLGLFGLLGAMRDPQVQAGLGVMIAILRQAAPTPGTPALPSHN